ncbi:protein-associating with the carboxyl-terminal domain of ezrin [Anopheles ziemanni]|uniref:protein-associating with the carboxyl-terminal domain of ezrin n=1 Tax=Anopheles coustani TaxID=139045 RepID=UPI002659076B|nr:protein-associating with the carboxyl-terminal domain of ezrin [Anopheles coustani]XP_058173125.1 protein-associating with the carboxyl-terminal domain of ezrin [Anopheles ziemanni]
MGNEQSQLKGVEISKKAIQVTDYWSLYNGELPNPNGAPSSSISIFQGETLVSGQFWTNQNPLERAIKNLKIYRHPYILKYFASWSKGSLKMLATERCRPLATCLNITSDVQICLGLRNILCALIFLLEQAAVRHLSISISSIYVTDDGAWRLAGFEHLWRTNDFNQTLLEKSQPYRYNKAIDPNELASKGQSLEQFAFGVMCEEILHNKTDINIPSVEDFKAYCATHLKHGNPAMRPNLSAVLLHPIFNHDFILIHSFLTELPLKNTQSKQEFFISLADRLRSFDPETVAEQMCSLLLSRIVLLDTTAQLCVTPYVLRPKTDDLSPGLFTPKIFSTYILPKVKQVFCVQDAQIRLMLLEYFPAYVEFFTKEDLQDHILPQLLLGIKDTNDVLVAKTLLCLADLVPILGSALVIGGNRSKIFADGRPQGIPDAANPWSGVRSITPVIGSDEFLSGSPVPDGGGDNSTSLSSVLMAQNNFNIMPERLSPEGEDIYQTNSDVEIEVDEWSDWENDGNERTVNHPLSGRDTNGPQIEEPPSATGNGNSVEARQTEAHVTRENSLESKRKPSRDVQPEESLERLDIKVKKIDPAGGEDFDFFKDMEPVIQKANVLLIDDDDDTANNDDVGGGSLERLNPPQVKSHTPEQQDVPEQQNARSQKGADKEEEFPLVNSSRLEIKVDEMENTEDGWGDEGNEDW